jgi:hypothetical protein
MRFESGQTVLVPCDIDPGAFPTERLVVVRSDGQELSGFIRTEFLAGPDGRATTVPSSGAGFVRGVIVTTSSEGVRVRLPGSFFTSASGQAVVSPSWAQEHLRELGA